MIYTTFDSTEDFLDAVKEGVEAKTAAKFNFAGLNTDDLEVHSDMSDFDSEELGVYLSTYRGYSVYFNYLAETSEQEYEYAKGILEAREAELHVNLFKEFGAKAQVSLIKAHTNTDPVYIELKDKVLEAKSIWRTLSSRARDLSELANSVSREISRRKEEQNEQ